MEKKTVLGLVGPTASGKTAVSLLLAQAIDGEIVCMDSMQVYRGMDIGTAKPTQKERALIPHHLLDVADPAQPFSVTEYAALARPALDQISRPILVGGTGFYLSALSLPLDFGFVRGDENVRKKYQQIAAEQGAEALHALLNARDPISAARLHPNDVRRVVRALEVFDLTGAPFSSQVMPDEKDAPYAFQLFALDFPRETLYRRIDRRVDEMLQNGLIEEVRALFESGLSPQAQAMQGLGYKELVPVLSGDETLENAAELIKRRTRNYAKRQLTWFRRDNRIHWLPADEQSTAERLLNPILQEVNPLAKR